MIDNCPKKKKCDGQNCIWQFVCSSEYLASYLLLYRKPFCNSQKQIKKQKMPLSMQMLQWAPISSTPSSSSSSSSIHSFAVLVRRYHHSFNSNPNGGFPALSLGFHSLPTPKRRSALVLAGMEDTELRASTAPQDNKLDKDDPTPQDLEYVRQIKRVSYLPFLNP